MSLHPVRAKQDSSNGGTYDYRRKAAQLWRGALETEDAAGYGNGSRDRHDLYGFTTGTKEWVLAESNGGTSTEAFSSVAKIHGFGRLGSTASAGAGEGSELLRYAPASGILITSTNNVLFETSLDNSTAAASLSLAPILFAGLFNSTGTTDGIISSSVLTTSKGYIGFYRTSVSDTLGSLTFVMASDNGGTTSSATVLTAAQLAAICTATNKQLNLGFRVNQRASVEIYVNGEYYKTASEALSMAALPVATLALTPAWVATNAITSPTNTTNTVLDIDWYETFVSAA